MLIRYRRRFAMFPKVLFILNCGVQDILKTGIIYNKYLISSARKDYYSYRQNKIIKIFMKISVKEAVVS